MKKRVKTEDGLELSTICRQLKMKASDGKLRETDVADTQQLLRLIQSIPSPKVLLQTFQALGIQQAFHLRNGNFVQLH